MFDVAWELFKSPLVWVMLAAMVVGIGFIAYEEYKERTK